MGGKLEVLHLLGLLLEMKSGSFKTLVWWEKYLWMPENQVFQVLGWECVCSTNLVPWVMGVAKGRWRDYVMVDLNVNLPQMGSPEYRDSIKDCPGCLNWHGKTNPTCGHHLLVATQIKRSWHLPFLFLLTAKLIYPVLPRLIPLLPSLTKDQQTLQDPSRHQIGTAEVLSLWTEQLPGPGCLQEEMPIVGLFWLLRHQASRNEQLPGSQPLRVRWLLLPF